jgi:hypothetical protein
MKMRKNFNGASSVIRGISYNNGTGLLTVHLHKNRTSNSGKHKANTPRGGKSRYQFATPLSVAQDFANATSAGNFFRTQITPNYTPVD